MSILKYKYKAHKFINYAFYIVVFIFGFLLGFTTQKLDFNKLISQVLMIDNVSALEDTNNYICNGESWNEETIIKALNLVSNNNFSIEEFPYISVSCGTYNNKSSLSIKVIDKIGFDLMYGEIDGNFYYLKFNESENPGKLIYFNYVFDDNSVHLVQDYGVSTNGIIISYYYSHASYSNFDYPDFPDSFNTKNNVLDFSKFGLDYKLNDGSIFEDENHKDFKKYCWENFDELVFSITIDNSYDGSFKVHEEGQQDGETYIKSGFYVFDDIFKLKRGTRIKALGSLDYYFDSSTWLGGLTFNHLQNIKTEFELLHTEENLGLRYSAITDALGNYDITRGDSYYYDNLDKLKNSSYVDFTYYFNVVDDFRYDVFYLKEEKENFCIYVPNVFIVTTLGLNELGGFVGDIPLHNDKNDSFIDVSETTGQLHFNQLFSIINKFINSIKDTVIFINDFIYSFFIALHPLIQMFIFTVITLLIVKLIIGMVVR